MKNNFEKFIEKISTNKEKNIKLARKYLKENDLGYLLTKSVDGSYISIDYDEVILLVVEALLECGANPNHADYPWSNLNFLQISLMFNYSEDFIIRLIDLGVKYKIDLNNYGFKESRISEPLGHILISESSFQKRILPIYKYLVENGYDIFLIDSEFKNLKEKANLYKERFDDWEEFINEYDKDVKERFENKKEGIIKFIESKYSISEFKTDNDERLLHVISKYKYDKNIIFEVIKYFLDNGLDPNKQTKDYKETFISVLLYEIPDGEFITKVVELALKKGLNPNLVNVNGDTILHDLILSKYEGKIIPIYLLLKKYGFNQNIKNDNGENIIDTLTKYTTNITDKYEFITEYSNDFNTCQDQFIIDMIKLKEIGELINKKTNITKPPFFVEVDYNDDSEDNKCIALISKIGGGKTSMLQYSAEYLYNEGKKVFITSIDKINKNSDTIGKSKELLLEIMDKCSKHDVVLCIDDIDKLYNQKLSYYQKQELDILIRFYVENKNLSLIFSVSKNNHDNIIDGILEDCVYCYYIEDLNNEELKQFIKDNWMYKEYDKDNRILNLIKELSHILTRQENMNESNVYSNIKVINDIISDIYNIYYDNDNKYFEVNDLINSIKINQYIKENIKEIIIEELSKINNNINEKNVELMIKKLTK